MDVGAPLVADGQPAETVEPSQGAFDDPALAAQALTRLDACAGDARNDVALPQQIATKAVGVAFVGVEFDRAFAPPSVGLFGRADGIDRLRQHRTLGDVGGGQHDRERDAGSVDHKMALRSRFAAIRRVRAGASAPLLAGVMAASTLARLQSIWSASPNRSSSVWRRRSQTPAACQSRSRRQQVMPEPQPSSWGSISHGMPDLRTKMIPVNTARSGTGGRPPLGLGGADGRSGATMAQRSSLTSGFAIRHVCHVAGRFC